MKNNILSLILAAIIGSLSAIFLIIGVGNAVSVNSKPILAEIRDMKAIQRVMQHNLDDERKDVRNELSNLSNRLLAIETKLNNVSVVAPPSAKGPSIGGCGGRPQEDLSKVYSIAVGESMVLGKKNAPITIVAFFDLQCPFCSRFYPPIQEVLKAYPDKVNFVIKNYPLPFHNSALAAAKLTLAAQRQGKYFEMVDLLLQNGASVLEDKVKDYAKKLGINYNKLMADYRKKDAQWQKRIDEDKALAEKVNVHGTPTFFINGRLTSAREFSSYKTEIDKVLSGGK